jgi:hypothetical protein
MNRTNGAGTSGEQCEQLQQCVELRGDDLDQREVALPSACTDATLLLTSADLPVPRAPQSSTSCAALPLRQPIEIGEQCIPLRLHSAEHFERQWCEGACRRQTVPTPNVSGMGERVGRRGRRRCKAFERLGDTDHRVGHRRRLYPKIFPREAGEAPDLCPIGTDGARLGDGRLPVAEGRLAAV